MTSIYKDLKRIIRLMAFSNVNVVSLEGSKNLIAIVESINTR